MLNTRAAASCSTHRAPACLPWPWHRASANPTFSPLPFSMVACATCLHAAGVARDVGPVHRGYAALWGLRLSAVCGHGVRGVRPPYSRAPRLWVELRAAGGATGGASSGPYGPWRAGSWSWLSTEDGVRTMCSAHCTLANHAHTHVCVRVWAARRCRSLASTGGWGARSCT